MEHNITTDQLISALARELVADQNRNQIFEIGANNVSALLLRVLALPDKLYFDLFKSIAISQCVEANMLVQTFTRFTLSHFTIQLNQSATMSQEVIVKIEDDTSEWKAESKSLLVPEVKQISQCTEEKHKLNMGPQRTQSQQQLAFQNLFAASVIKMLNASKVHFQPATNKELCERLNEYLASSRYSNFWAKLADLIPAKTPVQLKEYYKKSFSRFMFQENISFGDKALLRYMLHQMPNAKPSQIVDQFLEKTGNRSYFKRNLIMYLVNLRSKRQ
ncbi:Conserved_hypothetical protein [Hexamita inflata]|uniref:Uncharacterized protein n=1 Tax=Hexamita inflata TaxID=28002 RepID=A0AA86Q358_9EUKA|nr:Conserved hypothetical protein [Hexamita inflata]